MSQLVLYFYIHVILRYSHLHRRSLDTLYCDIMWCGLSGLWLFRLVAVTVCDRIGLWSLRFVVVSVCGYFDCDRSSFWVFQNVPVMTCCRQQDEYYSALTTTITWHSIEPARSSQWLMPRVCLKSSETWMLFQQPVHDNETTSMQCLSLVQELHLWPVKSHDDIKWKHFPRYWPFVRGIHRSPVNSPYKGQWRGTLMLSFICAWINGWINNRKAGDLRCYRAHCDVTVMRSQRDSNADRISVSWRHHDARYVHALSNVCSRYIPFCPLSYFNSQGHMLSIDPISSDDRGDICILSCYYHHRIESMYP